nr:sensor histidine kinase [uncultured Niameybacter sp.]
MKLIQFVKNLKYRYKIYGALICVSLIPVIILGYFCYNETTSLLLEREKQNMESSLTQVSSSLTSQIKVYTNLANYISFDKTITEVLEMEGVSYFQMYDKYTKVIDPLLSAPKYFHKGIKQITIYSENIQVEHDTTIAPLSKIEEEPWYLDFKENKGTNWTMEYIDENKVLLLRKFPRLNNQDAILSIALEYEQLFQSFREAVLPNSVLFMTDNKGRVIFVEKNLTNKEKDREWEEIQLGKILSSNINMQSEVYTCVQKDISTIGWNLYLLRENTDIASSANQITWTVVIVILICLWIIFVLGYTLSYLAVHPIEKLTENMNQVEQGNLEVSISSNSQDEIGILIHSFERMINQIKNLIGEVYESKLALKEFEMKALQAQINPHFLYNSLSIINWKALKANVPEISKITLTLSTFYRTTLNRGKNLIRVEDEVKNVKAYLDIQEIMHDYNFKIIEEVDEDLNDYVMPNLILQPIVENAIGHGIDLKEDGEKILKLIGTQDEYNIYFIVEDNGVGIEPEKLATLLTYQAKGYGVKNVNDRIILLYGEQYALQVESEVGKGTRVKVTIPKNALNEGGK